MSLLSLYLPIYFVHGSINVTCNVHLNFHKFCYDNIAFDCRCLNPGKYAQHLERWLSFYLPQQLHIIDGEQLRQNPVETLHELQRFLKITPAFNYSSHLRYDPKKGFFCQVTNEDRTKCLGKSKGRQYPPMEDRSYKLLQVKLLLEVLSF